MRQSHRQNLLRATALALGATLLLVACRPKPEAVAALKGTAGATRFFTVADQGRLRIRLEGTSERIVEVRTLAIASDTREHTLQGPLPDHKYIALVPSGTITTDAMFTIEATSSAGHLCHMQGRGAGVPGSLPGVVCDGSSGVISGGAFNLSQPVAAPKAAATPTPSPAAAALAEFTGACKAVWGDVKKVGKDSVCQCDAGASAKPKAVTLATWKRDHTALGRICAGE